MVNIIRYVRDVTCNVSTRFYCGYANEPVQTLRLALSDLTAFALFATIEKLKHPVTNWMFCLTIKILFFLVKVKYEIFFLSLELNV